MSNTETPKCAYDDFNKDEFHYESKQMPFVETKPDLPKVKPPKDNEDKQKELEELKSKLSNYISEHKDSLDTNIVSIMTKFINEEELSSEEMIYLLLHIFMGQRGFESLQNYIQNKIRPDVSLPMQQCILPSNPSEAEKFQSIQQLVNVKIDSPEYIEQMKQILDECKNTTPFITKQTNKTIFTCGSCEYRKRVGDNRQYLICSKTERELPDIDLMTYIDKLCPFYHKGEIDISKQTKQDIDNKFCTVQGFEKEINKRVNDKFFQTIDYEQLPEDETDIQRANDPKFTLKVIAILIIILFTSFFIIGLFGMVLLR